MPESSTRQPPRAAQVPPEPEPRPAPRRGVRRAATAAAGAATLLLAGHAWIPPWHGLGSALDSVLPWIGVPVVVAAIAATLLRSRPAVVVAAAGLLTWAVMFGPTLLDRTAAGPHDLRIVTLNVGAANRQPRTAIETVAAAGPDLIVLQELTRANLDAADAVLGPAFTYREVAGTVGVWSRLPLSGTEPIDIRIGWTRGLRTSVATAHGPVRLYAVHLASARPGETAERDLTLAALAALVRADPATRLIVAGDLNTATTDRRLAELEPLRDTQSDAGAGFGFTFPAGFPVIRPDHVLQRGMRTRRAAVLQTPGSDHRAAVADLDTT